MADWSDISPGLSTNYVTVLSNLRDRDKDAAAMLGTSTNPFDGMMRYNRGSDKFQIYNASLATWEDRQIGVEGGGTGAANSADARANLDLGTMSTQNNNGVNITGGTIANAATTATAGNSANAIVARDASGNFAAGQITATVNGTLIGSCTGNAGSVSNGVYTIVNYSDPAWITDLNATKLTAGEIPDARLASNIPRINTSPIAMVAYGNDSGAQIVINAGQTIEVFYGSTTYTSIYQRDTSSYITTNIESGNYTAVNNSGVYLVITTLTFQSSNDNVTFRARIYAGASGGTETYIIARSETAIFQSSTANEEYRVMNLAGLILTPTSPYYVGVKVYADKASYLQSFPGQMNNTLTVARLW